MKYVKKALLGGYTELSGREPGAYLLFSENELHTYLEEYHRSQSGEEIRQHAAGRIQAEAKQDQLKAESEAAIRKYKKALEQAQSAVLEWKEYSQQLKEDAEKEQARLKGIMEHNEILYGNLRRINRERANYKQDFWEIILRHTGDPTKAPEAFLKPRKPEEEMEIF